MSTYAMTKQIPAGQTAELTTPLLPFASRHTLQIEGGTINVSAKLVGASSFGPLDTGLTDGVYSDMVAHRVAAFEVANTGATPVTVHFAGGA